MFEIELKETENGIVLIRRRGRLTAIEWGGAGTAAFNATSIVVNYLSKACNEIVYETSCRSSERSIDMTRPSDKQ